MYSLTPSPRKTSFVKDRCAWCVDENIPRQPLQFFRQRYESVTLGASSSLAAANSRITRQLEAQESTRVVTANSPPPLSLSSRSSRSPPLFLFRLRNYSGVIAFRPHPRILVYTNSREKKKKKKKKKKVRVARTHCTRDRTKRE